MNDPQIWELQWFVEHLPPEAPDDAHLEPPLQEGENDFWHLDPLTGPFRTPLVFGAAFVAVAATDYPDNNLNWPLVTAPLLEALDMDGSSSITPFPVRLMDVEPREADDPRWNASAEEAVDWALTQPHLVRDDISVLHVAPLEGVLDLSASQYRTFADGIGIRSVDTFVFRAPAGGVPAAPLHHGSGAEEVEGGRHSSPGLPPAGGATDPGATHVGVRRARSRDR